MAYKIFADSVRKTFFSNEIETIAVDDITFGVRGAEFVCLLGPSGCGKTTLLNLFAGFELPSSGRMSLDEHEILGPGPERGVVFQEHALFPWLTVQQNVQSGKRLQSRPPSERAEAVERFLGIIGLEQYRDYFPSQLSGGMRQRVSIARALANEPEVLLMDEPFAALDAITRTALQEELIGIWQATRKTIVFVTHNIEEAVFLGDRIAVMTPRPGRIKEIVEVELPKPRDVNSPEFNAVERRVRALLVNEMAA